MVIERSNALARLPPMLYSAFSSFLCCLCDNLGKYGFDFFWLLIKLGDADIEYAFVLDSIRNKRPPGRSSDKKPGNITFYCGKG